MAESRRGRDAGRGETAGDEAARDAAADRGHPSWLDRVREQEPEPEGDGPGAWQPRLWNGDGGSADDDSAAPLVDGPAPAESAPWNDVPASPARPSVPWSETSDALPEESPLPTPEPDPWRETPARAPGAHDPIPEEAPDARFGERVGLSVARLRSAALEMARQDAEAGLPEPEAKGICESERELRDRCRALFRGWQARERDRLNERVGETEERITRTLAEAALDVDRFERVTSELFRLQRRWEANRELVRTEIERRGEPEEEEEPQRGFKTRWYALAIGFLGLVEFLANAPVFGALLPRDPLTEQQLRMVAETSEGWLAGATRVVSQFILRPDAALLAAGVVTFLCVLAHFFGHSLRSYLVHKSGREAGETVDHRSPSEFVVPMILSGLGLALVIGVLFEARVTLGEVARDRFAQDSAKIEELRRTASWLRVDGNLVAANEQANRADDLEAVAKEQREYAASMSGLSFPILLLNTTLVLVAISAAYFHLRDPRRHRFNERPFEQQRQALIRAGDLAQDRVGEARARLVRYIRELRSLLTERPLKEWPALAHQLEATVLAYRAENGRIRGLDPRSLEAFREPVDLELAIDEKDTRELLSRDPADYEHESRQLVERFADVRARFTQEATTW